MESDGVETNGIPKRKLTHIDLEITRACNLDCIHCSAAHKSRGKELTFEFIQDMLHDAKKNGLQRIGFTGGEPFLNRTKLKKVANFARNNLKLPIHIHSNGTEISEYDANWIKKIDAEITVPLYGDTAKIHDNITNKPGSFSLTLQGCRNLLAFKANLFVYIVPMKMNLKSISSIIRLVSKEGVKHVRILTLSPTGRAKRQFENLELEPSDFLALSKDLDTLKNELDIDLSAGFCTSHNITGLNILKGHEKCFAGENRVHIDTCGNVFPCTASSGKLLFSAGNVQSKENSLQSIWLDSPLFQFLRAFHKNPPKKCVECLRYNQCMSGCRLKMSYKYNDVTIADPFCGGPFR